MVISFALFLCCVLSFIVLVESKTSLVLTMLCRDESVNLKANLPTWLPIVDYFVFVLDSRSTDTSEIVISEVLGKAGKPYVIVQNNFTGFGQARTLSLDAAWKHYPHASHVLISDPDWVPNLVTTNLNELDGEADVFRFIIYDAERDGQSNKRYMDWLLRHRQGLAMKYHLHEVLDIPSYKKVKRIGWEVREVERKGTWHTTLGHGSSVSADRYRFDLELLYKDLAQFGHDPHVHYYLGVTHESYATKTSASQGLHAPEVQEHIYKAIQYYTLRATSMYSDELPDQRWGALIGLGNIYTFQQRNDVLAVRWLSTCYDYDPGQVECALMLAQLYRRLGQLKPALQVLTRMLGTERSADRHSAQVDLWDCDLPGMAVDLLAAQAQMQGVSAAEAMLFFVLLEMTKTPHCSKKHKLSFNRATKTALHTALGAPNADFFVTPNAFCADPVLQRYLAEKRYTMHPCDTYREARERQLKCDIFEATSLPAYEELQLSSFGGNFIGTAILSDIVHHAFQGHSGTFLTKGRPLRFLFAEHFSADMVFNLLGQLQRQPVENFEIVVLSPVAVTLETVKSRLAYCRGQVRTQQASRVKFVAKTLLHYAESAAAAGQFDFIEYNGGLSKAADPQAELRALAALLHDGATLGLTYFVTNHHVQHVQDLVDRRNATHMVPFSMEAARLVRNYLEQHKLGLFARDRELATLLGGEALQSLVPLYRADMYQPRVNWRTYAQSEVESLVSAEGLSVSSWVPTAYAHPFDEMPHYEVQKYRALGMSQAHFVEELMPSFRYSLYLLKGPLGAECGRRRLSEDIFEANASSPSSSLPVASALTVVDRVGSLAHSFQGMEQLAERQQSTSIEFAHYAMPGDTRFNLIVSPLIAPCLPHLSSRPSIQSLHEMNRDFAAKMRRSFDEGEARSLLLALLSYLERLNMVTWEYAEAPAGSARPGRPFKLETLADKNRGGGRGGSAREQRRDESFESGSRKGKVGGLSVKPGVKSDEREVTKNSANHSPRTQINSASAGPSTADASKSLTAVEQVSRMRALGYSDETIEQLLGFAPEPISSSAPVDVKQYTIKYFDSPAAYKTKIAENSPPPKGLSADSATATTTTAQENSAKARDVIDLLKRFTQQRAAEAGARSASASAFASAQVTSDGASAAVSMDAAGRAHAADPPVQMENKYLIVNMEAAVASDSKETDAALPSGLVTSGGLKLPQRAAPTPSPAASALKHAPATAESLQGRGGGIISTKQELRVEQIKMPPLLTPAAIAKSPRNLDCTAKLSDVQPEAHCQEQKVLKRKTCQLASTSARKIEFELAQLAYLRRQQRTVNLSDSAQATMTAVEESYRAVSKFLAEFSLDGAYKVVRLNSNSAIADAGKHLNRALHVARDDGLPAAQLVHAGAMQYLHSIRREVDAHDYLVVDVILQAPAMAHLSALLLTSTVWFDATNGAAFAAHHDDGLAFPTVHTLVQQVALALSDSTKRFSVSGYFTLAMDLQHESHSPVFMANKDDVNVVLWLNPQTAAEEQTSRSGTGTNRDGLRIYNEASAGKLFSQGVSVYPSAHSDFLSRSSSLAIDLGARCNASHSEFVPRSPNRLVVVRSKKLCTLLTPGKGGEIGTGAAAFDKSTMIALVMVLTPSTSA